MLKVTKDLPTGQYFLYDGCEFVAACQQETVVLRLAAQLSSINFSYLRSINVKRCIESFKHQLADWSLAEWANACAGEMGEACNVAKKILRLDKTPAAARDSERDRAELVAKLGDEIADTVIYLDLLAAAAGLDLGEAVRRKFNATSEERRCSIKL